MREGIYQTDSNEMELVLNALSRKRCKEFELTAISQPQRGFEISPAIQDYRFNSMISSTFSFYGYDYADSYLLNGFVFWKWEEKGCLKQ
jgi:hypothetical protein